MILTDDLGWQDVKCYDIDKPSPMETPNIDALAKKGVMFWQAYSPAPTCGPSRCAIMSGTHPARAQMTHVSGGKPPRPHHRRAWSYISPWYTARMPADELTLAKIMQQHGYSTGHSGKWHMSKNHNSFPAATDQGFAFSRHSRGAQNRMPNRLTGFATDDPQDPYRLDQDGYPHDQTTEDALTFLKDQGDRPFFLYYATWLVHSPWQMRSERLLNKYVEKLGVELSEESRTSWKIEGQNNPFYCAMVELLDHYVGRIIHHLETTDDPRWPGHKLIENTCIIFTSDNGGMEGSPNEIATDNHPLDKGKISLMEGGTRVPLIITGAGIPQGVQTDVMVNGLDFYPTILSLAGIEKPKDKHLDGRDLTALLKNDPTNPALVREANGKPRDTMVWHFPNSSAQESTIRIGDYKLVRNYFNQPELELYRLYQTANGKPTRVDIEETNNLANALPDKTTAMNRRLTEILTGMNASYPYLNPNCPRLPLRVKAPTILSARQQGDRAEFTYRENGAKALRANLIYTRNGGHRDEEWFRTPASLSQGNQVTSQIPPGATHYFLNLIDENNFLVSHPDFDEGERVKRKLAYSDLALKANAPLPTKAKPDAMWTYKRIGAKELQLSVFLPDEYESADQPFPVMVWFHGGSWNAGKADWHYPDCAYWAQRGMVALSVDYRLRDRDGVRVPLECVKDAKSAIIYLRKNAAQLKLDPKRIVAAGGSAGGQLAAATACIRGPETYDDPKEKTPCVPNAVVLTNPWFRCHESLAPPAHIRSGLPPTITFIGDQDPAIPVASMRDYHSALQAAQVSSELHVGKGGKHGFCNGRNSRNPYFYWSLELTGRFLVKHGILTSPPRFVIPPGVPTL